MQKNHSRAYVYFAPRTFKCKRICPNIRNFLMLDFFCKFYKQKFLLNTFKTPIAIFLIEMAHLVLILALYVKFNVIRCVSYNVKNCFLSSVGRSEEKMWKKCQTSKYYIQSFLWLKPFLFLFDSWNLFTNFLVKL